MTMRIFFDIAGDDELEETKSFLSLLDSDPITSQLDPNSVAIKLTNGTEACNQFAQIYPVVLIPSIYFIDSATGVDLEVTGGLVTEERLQMSIQKVLNREKQPVMSRVDLNLHHKVVYNLHKHKLCGKINLNLITIINNIYV